MKDSLDGEHEPVVWRCPIPGVSAVLLCENWLVPERAWHLLFWLRYHVDWQQLPVRVFGRRYWQPRLCAFVGRSETLSYQYSGLTLQAQPWPMPIAQLAEQLYADCAISFNACLLNLYRHGEDRMGMHSDNEPELGSAPHIAIVSLGGDRFLKMKHRRSGQSVRISLPHGSLLWMRPPCQRDWQHGIGRQARAKPRISLTFRTIIDEIGDER
ncbi:MAG: alpha-ketoglutarate-dependent dioxygenase AlkB [Gammaproteobacteria bacterium]|nr:MAG: alpha-ketoglutarate-dependent dioxygenase AlkB [Gammaproteobacteria bacterium]